MAHDAGLLRCIAAHRRAQNISKAWHQTVYDPAYKAYQAALEAVPHHTTVASFQDDSGSVPRTLHMRTDRPIDVAVIEVMQEGRTFGDDDFGLCCRELGKALAARNAQIEKIRRDWKATGFNKHSDHLGDLSYEKFEKILDYPVRTPADLILKLETIQKHDDDHYSLETILDDLKRIAGRA
jgi:hypothetical protein